MSQYEKSLIKIMCGTSDNDILFSELIKVLNKLGFKERIKGSHHIYFKDEIEEILNLQPINSKCKAYQVKQIRNIILKYELGGALDV